MKTQVLTNTGLSIYDEEIKNYTNEKIAEADSSSVKDIKINGTSYKKETDGSVNITSFSTDVLVNGENILILNCGNATSY